MSLKTLPKSLIDAVSEVVANDTRRAEELTKTLSQESLKVFGVTDPSTITESDIKAMYSWAAKEFERRMAITEAECTCGADMKEDDMPGDAALHVDGDESAEKKKEMGESEEVSEDDEVKLDEEDSQKHIEEGVALSADDVATNGAVGVGDAEIALPKHADVIKDSSPLDGTAQYRILVQFATNSGTQIIPSTALPGAPSVEALREIVEGLPYFNDVMDVALKNVM